MSDKWSPFSKWEEKRTVFQMKFKDKSPVFKALRGSELLNQLEIWRWKNENFYLLAMPLSYFSVRVNFIKRNIGMQRRKKKEMTVRRGKCRSLFGFILLMILISSLNH